ncbi:gliding motility-associated C-terminal domain-containing protein [Flavobacterium sp. LB3P122]|uniref:DUF7507 domain-containing protein n=1 Tax=Flavobacterium algoriphilum TaxID=3398738 RepID=UPI003A849B02
MKSIFTYSTKLFSLFLISFLSISTAVAQTGVPNPNTSCTSGDLELVGATLTGGDLCNSCSTNTVLTRTLTLSINNTTGSTRTSFAFWGNLEEYSGIDGSLISTIAISGCRGPLPGHTITSLTFNQVSYTCGNTLKINNLFLAWTDAGSGSTCPLNPATISPKCGKLPLIQINAGVNGEFVVTNSQCGIASGKIDLTPIGGKAPYTYYWTTLDGAIPSGQEDDQDLINVFAGTYNVIITDANGCTITKSRIITATPPTVALFAQVSDITVACGAATTSSLNYTNSSTGNCIISGSVNSTLSSQSPYGSCGGDITESWTFTDIYLRTITASRIIHVSPAALPTMTSPGNITVSCGSIPVSSTISFSNGLSGGCLISGTSNLSTFSSTPNACGGTVTETWSSKDICGRTITAVSRIITVTPAALPTMSPPANITVACGSIPVPSTISFSNGLNGGCLISGTSDPSTFSATPNGCGGTVIETWTAMDNCGRTVTAVSRTITVSPATLPTMTAPGNITVACGSMPAPRTINFSNGLSSGCLISGTSNPSSFSITPNACGGTVTETWTGMDICGRTVAAVSRIITVNPAALPTMTAPSNITVACGSIPAPSTINFTNGLNGGCLISGTSNFSTFSSSPNSCGGTVTETWNATDSCGRTITTVSRIITVSPAILPIMTAPSNITVACGSIPAPSTINFTNGLNGGCLISGTSNSSNLSSIPNSCGGTVTETWAGTDTCGRTVTTVSRIITVSPAVLPIMTAPANITVSCGAIPASTTITFSNGLSGACLISGTSNPSTFSTTVSGYCNGKVIETWTATDICGRAVAIASRTITIDDKTLPTFTPPVSSVIYKDANCNYNADPNITGNINDQADNCTNKPGIIVTHSDTSCFGTQQQWNVNAGNGILIDFNVQGFDGQPATAIKNIALSFNTNQGTGHAEITLVSPLGQAIILVGPYCSDLSCVAGGAASYTPVFYGSGYPQWNNVNNPTGAGNYTPLGGTSTNSQYIPGFNGYISNFSQFTGEMNGIWRIYARKQSTENGTLNINNVCLTPNEKCANDDFIIRHWAVSDACGNTKTADQIILIKDNMAPVITLCAHNQTIPADLSCKALVPDFTSAVTATDNCTPSESLIISQFPLAGTEVGSGTTTITLTVKDACGKETTCEAKLIVTNYIVANDDAGTTINGYTGGISFINVLANDLLNCIAVNVKDVNLSIIGSTNTGITLSGANVVVAPGTPAGNYTLTYEICEKLNPTNCDTGIVTVTVYVPSITLLKDGTYVDINNDGITNVGDTINYSFMVINSGTSTLSNVTVTDTNAVVTGMPIASLSVDASDSATFSAVHTITQADINTGFVYNLATASGTPPSGPNVTGTSSDPTPCSSCPVNPECQDCTITPLTQTPSIAITKDGNYVDANNDGITNIGDTVTYNFVITNTGNVTLNNITVADINAVVTGVPIASLTVGASDSTTFSAVHTITQADINTGFVYNLATATGTPPSGPNVMETSSDPTPCTSCPVNPECPDCTITPLTQNPSIAITKDGIYVDANNDGITNIGDIVTYNFTVTNTGNVTVNNITVTDINAIVTGGPIAFLTVGASDSTTFSAVHTITQADINTGFVYNLATATGTPPSGPNLTDTSSDPTPCTSCPINPECPNCTITPLTQNPSIVITKDGTYVDANNDGITNIGDTVTYNFIITNTGNVTVNNITVTDTNALITGGPIASLTVGASESATFSAVHTITQADINTGFVYNLATATGTPPEGPNVMDTSSDPTPCSSCPVNPECPDCTITPLTQNPSIAITKDGIYVDANNDGITNIGDTVTYNFVITNTGNVTLNNITVADINAVVTGVPIASLTVGATDSTTFSAVHTITQADINTGFVYNLATATGTPPSGPNVMDTASDPTPCTSCPINLECPDCTITPLTQNPSIAITKDGIYVDANNDGITNIGDTVTYNFTVTNTGNVSVNNITVTDINAVVTGGPIASLTVGASDSTTFSAVHTITQADINTGFVYNLATATGTPPSGPNLTDTSSDPTPCTSCAVNPECPDCTITPLTQTPSITLVKTGTFNDTNNDGFAQAGEKINYTFTITNTGNVTVTNIVITDPLIGLIITNSPISILAPGVINSSVTGGYTITQADIDGGKVINSALASGKDPKGSDVTDISGTTVQNNTPTVTLLPQTASIALVKTGIFSDTNNDGFPQVGEKINYTFTVTNTGNVIASNIVITDPLIGLLLNGSPIANLVSGASNNSVTGIYTITQADIDAGKVTNSALAFGKDPKGNDITDISGTTITNNTPTVTTLNQNPGLEVIKTSNTENYSSVGDIINYTIQVKNIGNVTLFAIIVTDPLTGLNTTIQTLAPDGTQIFTQNYTVTQEDRVNGSVTNVANANGFTPNEVPISDSDEEVVEASIVLGCGTILVHNAFSPNADGINENFIIDNIDDVVCYPDNTVEIYNRWGVLVFETKGYNNTSNVFKGISEGRTTIGQSSGLPSGTYFYILNYTSIDGNGGVQSNKKDGYLYLTK